MRHQLVRMLLVVMTGAALIALGRAASTHQFAWLEATGTSPIRLDLVPLEPARSGSSGTIATFGEGANLVRLEVLGSAQPPARLPIVLFVADAAGIHRAEGHFIIEEGAPHLAGRFEAEGNDRKYAGGLRILVVPVETDARLAAR